MNTLPHVNINGTSRRALIDQRTEALSALLRAEQALQRMAPHPRDYIGDAARYGAALEEHQAWVWSVHVVYVELMKQSVALQERNAQ